MSRTHHSLSSANPESVLSVLLARFSFALTICLLVPLAGHAQTAEAEIGASIKDTAKPPAPTRIIDMEAARRAKQREHSFQVTQLPLVPFQFIGHHMEKGLLAVDRNHLLDKAQYYMTERERGFVPVFGNLGVGTGLTVGVKYYRNDFLHPGGHIEFPVRVSTLLYQEYGAALRMPVDSGQKIFFDAGAFYRVRARDNFFGLGNDSRSSDRTTYMLQSREIFLGPRFELPGNLRLVTRFGYVSTEVFDGKDARFPVISSRFYGAPIAGLFSGANEWVGGFELVHDTRDIPGRPRRGGYHSLAASWHQSADSRPYGFMRYELNAERYVPLGRRNRTLVLRFQGMSNQPGGGSGVPFFEQAVMGGLNTLRGFPECRFHDLSGMLISAEYRYNLNSYMELVAIVDAGEVARNPRDFTLSGLHASYGGGVRFLSKTSTPLKIMVAKSNEGTRVYFSIGATF